MAQISIGHPPLDLFHPLLSTSQYLLHSTRKNLTRSLLYTIFHSIHRSLQNVHTHPNLRPLAHAPKILPPPKRLHTTNPHLRAIDPTHPLQVFFPPYKHNNRRPNLLRAAFPLHLRRSLLLHPLPNRLRRSIRLHVRAPNPRRGPNAIRPRLSITGTNVCPHHRLSTISSTSIQILLMQAANLTATQFRNPKLPSPRTSTTPSSRGETSRFRTCEFRGWDCGGQGCFEGVGGCAWEGCETQC